jgi:hypothetical protein
LAVEDAVMKGGLLSESLAKAKNVRLLAGVSGERVKVVGHEAVRDYFNGARRRGTQKLTQGDLN